MTQLTRRLGRQLASALLFALIASTLLAAVAIAQDNPAEPSQAPPAAESSEPAAPPAEPAPEQPATTDPPPTAEPAPAPVGIGVEVPAAPAPEASAPAATPAPEPAADPAPAAPSEVEPPAPVEAQAVAGLSPETVEEMAPAIVEELMAEPSAASGDGGSPVVTSAQRQSAFGSLDKRDYFSGDTNDCREFGGDSDECGDFLYGEICISKDEGERDWPEGGRYYDAALCADVLAANACTSDPDSEDCRLILNNSCFDPDTADKTKCFHIRNALFEPDNPCRQQGPGSPECQAFATPQRCAERALADEDCTLYLLFLSSFSADDEARCLDAFRNQGAAAAAGTSRTCALYVSMVMDACTFLYPPSFGCGPLRFGGSDEAEGEFDDAGDGEAGPVGGPGAGSGGSFVPAIFDPGRDDDATEPVSDEGGDGDRRRRARALPRSGRDLDVAVLLGLALTALGVGMHWRLGRYERNEAAR